MWLLRSQLPESINTVEKLYLWCYYQLSSTTERVDIEGEEEFVIDAELVRPDGVDERLFLVTKINLPFAEDWIVSKLKLWENAQQILITELTRYFYTINNLNGYCAFDISSLITEGTNEYYYYAINSLDGYCGLDLTTLPTIELSYYKIEELNGYCPQQL